MNIESLRREFTVLFDDFLVDPSASLSDQLDILKEDMLQVELEGGYLLDVGWRPSFSPEGEFKILLIKDFDWDNPVYSGEAKSMGALEEQIGFAMRVN